MIRTLSRLSDREDHCIQAEIFHRDKQWGKKAEKLVKTPRIGPAKMVNLQVHCCKKVDYDKNAGYW